MTYAALGFGVQIKRYHFAKSTQRLKLFMVNWLLTKNFCEKNYEKMHPKKHLKCNCRCDTIMVVDSKITKALSPPTPYGNPRGVSGRFGLGKTVTKKQKKRYEKDLNQAWKKFSTTFWKKYTWLRYTEEWPPIFLDMFTKPGGLLSQFRWMFTIKMKNGDNKFLWRMELFVE